MNPGDAEATAVAGTPTASGRSPALTVGPALAGARAGSTFVFFPADPDISAALFTYPGFTAGATPLIDTATFGGRSRQFQEVLNDAGAWQATFAQDEVGIDPGGTVIDFNDVVLFYFKGQAAFPALAEKRVFNRYAQGEEADESVVWSGRGLAAVLEQAVVYPSRGVGVVPIEDNRAFNWATPSYDDSAWAFAKELETIGAAKDNWAGLSQVPPAAAGFDDDAAFVLWADPYTYITAPAGQCFFRQTFTVPNDGSYIVQAVADDWGHFYLDGQPVMGLTNDFQTAQSTTLTLSAGTHLIAADVLNFFLADPLHNPGGFAFTVGDNLNGKLGTVHAHSDASCKIVPYADSAPGVTIGFVLELVLNEALARGVWSGTDLTWDFSTTTDSQGTPWATVADISTQVGTDLLTFLKEIAATHIDFWFGPADRTLHAVAIGARGSATAVTLHGPTDPTDPTTGNITHMTYTDQA